MLGHHAPVVTAGRLKHAVVAAVTKDGLVLVKNAMKYSLGVLEAMELVAVEDEMGTTLVPRVEEAEEQPFHDGLDFLGG